MTNREDWHLRIYPREMQWAIAAFAAGLLLGPLVTVAVVPIVGTFILVAFLAASFARNAKL